MLRRDSIAYGLDLHEEPPVLIRYAAGRSERIPANPAPSGVKSDADSGRRTLVVAARAQESVLLNLQLPVPSVETARKVLPSHLDIQLPFPIERAAYCFPRIRLSEGGTEAIGVAMRGEDLIQLARHAAETVADPVQIDHEVLAAWDQARREFPEVTRGLHGIVIASTRHLTAVLAHDDRIRAAPSIRIAREEDAPQAPRRLIPLLRAGLGDEAATPFPWILTGSRAGPALRDALERPTGTPFHTARDPECFMARALARRAAEGGTLPCELRSGPYAHAGLIQRTAARIRRAQWTIAACGLLLLAGSQAWLYALDERCARTQLASAEASSVLRPSTADLVEAIAAAVHSRTGTILFVRGKAGDEQLEWRMRGDPVPVIRALVESFTLHGYDRPVSRPDGPGLHLVTAKRSASP